MKLVALESLNKKKKIINSFRPNFYFYLIRFVVWLLINSISNIRPIHTKDFVINFYIFKNGANNVLSNSRNTNRKLYILRTWNGNSFLIYYFVGVLINRIIFTELSVIWMKIITVAEGLARNSDDRNLKSFFVLFLALGLHTSKEL